MHGRLLGWGCSLFGSVADGGHRLHGAEISFKENRDPSAGEAFLQGHGEDHQPAEV